MSKKVFIADDYRLSEVMGLVAQRLEANGVEIVRGPQTVPGTRLKYPDESLEALFADVDVAMFSSRSVCDDRVLNAAKKLRGIVNPTIAVDTVDVNAATEKGILVGNGAIPENYIEMAEATVLLMLMLLYDPRKSIAAMTGEVKIPTLISEHWAKMLYKKTVGIVGLGRIGRAVAQRLAPWGVNILAHDKFPPKEVPDGVTMVDLDTLYAQSDLIGVFLVVTEETRSMINAEAFRKMKDGVFFVNTARGQLVDEDALYEALRSGKVAGAALDTFQTEPLPEDSPLRQLDNIILTPHVIGHAVECQRLLVDAAVENVMLLLEGKPPKYLVNPGALDKFNETFKS